jgi:phosphohistidine phosphatase
VKLYLIRHGPAEDRAASLKDEDRALTPAGRERVRSVAKLLVEVGEAPLGIVTSPLVRAVQTAEIVALVTRLTDRGGHVEVRREMEPGGDVAALAGKFASAGSKRVMLVGHEPELSISSRTLLGNFDRVFDKAMVVAVHLPFEGRETRLRFVIDPKNLRLDPDARRHG